MTEQVPWIRARGLCFRHGSYEALKEVDLDFYPGCHYVLAGPNGAGKSTLLDLLANLKKPASGSLELHGRPLSSYAPMRLARLLALAPQEFRLNFSFTVREVVAMGRRPYLGRWGRLGPEDELVVERSLAELNLSDLKEKSVTALSGGEKQRVIAARTLAQATPIILLDEPTAGLDIAHALALMSLARRKALEGCLVITVTHDLNLAAAYGHHFVFLKKGRLKAAGSVEKAFQAQILSEVYEAEAKVTDDEFAGGPAASFRLPG